MAKKEPGKIERIAADLRAKIENGKFPPGGKLPSVSELQAAGESHSRPPGTSSGRWSETG